MNHSNAPCLALIPLGFEAGRRALTYKGRAGEMMKLTREELAFWERVFIAFVGSPREWHATSPDGFADAAVQQRRARYERDPIETPQGPYRGAGNA